MTKHPHHPHHPWYTPTEAEIRHRAMLMRMMTFHAWEPDLVEAIMNFDNPNTSTVLDLVRVYGVKGAKKRILEFLNL